MKLKMSRKSGSVVINGVKTGVRSWGRWIEDPTDKVEENIVVVIPGNPGIAQFYSEFAEIIHRRTGYTIWTISYAGHEVSKGIPSFNENKEKYGLKGQVQHKIEFFRKYIPKGAKVHVIGHSIGAYTTLQLLKDASINEQIAMTYLLFPAIERMADTSNGKILTCYVKPIVWLLCFLSGIFVIFPKMLQVFLLRIYLFLQFTPRNDYTIEAILSLINPVVLNNVFFLAYEELEQVTHRDNDVIKSNLDKINILYGELDGWAPKEFHDTLKSDIQGIHCSLSSFHHAFVLCQSKEVATLISGCISEKKYLS